MEKIVEGDTVRYTQLTGDEFSAGTMKARELNLALEYGKHPDWGMYVKLGPEGLIGDITDHFEAAVFGVE